MQSWTDSTLSALGPIRSVRHFEIQDCKLMTAKCIYNVMSQWFHCLEYLDLSGHNDISNDTLMVFECAFPHLNTLRLGCLPSSSNVKISTRGVAKIASGCPSLTHLDLSCCTAIDDEAMRYLGGLKLKDLRLNGLPALTSTGLELLCKGEKSFGIEHLELSECPCIGDVQCLSMNIPRLMYLELSRSIHVLEGGVVAVIRCIPGLKYLGLCGLRRITDQTLSSVRESGKSLQQLIIGGNKISDTGLKAFQSSRRDIQVSVEDRLIPRKMFSTPKKKLSISSPRKKSNKKNNKSRTSPSSSSSSSSSSSKRKPRNSRYQRK